MDLHQHKYLIINNTNVDGVMCYICTKQTTKPWYPLWKMVTSVWQDEYPKEN